MNSFISGVECWNDLSSIALPVLSKRYRTSSRLLHNRWNACYGWDHPVLEHPQHSRGRKPGNPLTVTKQPLHEAGAPQKDYPKKALGDLFCQGGLILGTGATASCLGRWYYCLPWVSLKALCGLFLAIGERMFWEGARQSSLCTGGRRALLVGNRIQLTAT